jgi:hypothetical protein
VRVIIVQKKERKVDKRLAKLDEEAATVEVKVAKE